MSIDAFTNDVIASARSRAGVHDFHSESFRDGLAIVAEAAQRDSSRLARRLSGECRRALMGRLRIDDWHRSHPQIGMHDVERPVFVIGMPRTGTTVLVNLLAQDRTSCRVLWHWEVDDPTPPVAAGCLHDDPRIAAKAAVLAPIQQRLAHFPRMETATDPVECVHVLAQDFKSLTWHTSTGSDEFNDWFLDEADLVPAYRHHRRTLQVLQSGGAAGQWILKLPSHALHLESLLTVYPDARLVFTHRDPMPALVSMCSYARMIHEANANPVHLSQLVDATWRQVLQSAIRPVEVLAAHPDVPVHHVHQQQLAADPIAEVRRLRAWLGLDTDDRLISDMRHYLEVDWPHPPGRHRYDASDFGITRSAVDHAFARYLDRFDVPLEVA